MSDRRILTYLVFLYKILNGLCENSELLGMINFRIPNHSTRNPDVFQCSDSRTNYHMYSSLQILLKLGNTFAPPFDIFNSSLFKYIKKKLLLQKLGYV